MLAPISVEVFILGEFQIACCFVLLRYIYTIYAMSVIQTCNTMVRNVNIQLLMGNLLELTEISQNNRKKLFKKEKEN